MFDFEDRWLDKSLKKSTVYEEIKRGKYNGRYTARIVQNRAEKRRRESHKESKWRNSKLLNFIERHLKMMWSLVPHELSENGVKFSHTSIYTGIKKHRPEWRKQRGKKVRHKASAGKILNRVSIEKRPKIVDSRRRFGDWEVDTVISCRGGKSCLAVFVERKLRLYRLVKMQDKSAGEMLPATIRTLKN